MMGMKISSTRIAITVPNTPKHCTTKAVVHCLNLPPSSSGITPMTGGAIRYRKIMLKMRATQSSMMTARSQISLNATMYITM